MTVAPAQALPFVHPSLAGAALLLGLVPLIIHLINRRRFRRVPWAAMKFLLAANRQSIRRMRLEQLLLLLLRIAVVVLLGLAVARPYASASALLGMGTSRVHHVLLLDNSRSMNAIDESGKPRFESAGRAAGDLLSSLPETDAVSLITLAEPAEAVIGHAAYDRRFVRKKLSELAATQRATDTAGALARASEIIKASELAKGNHAVYLVSDLPLAEWRVTGEAPATAAVSAARELVANGDVDLTVLPITSEEPLENAAVTELAAETSLIGVNLPVRVSARVFNHGSAPLRSTTLQILRDGQILDRIALPSLAAGESTLAPLTTMLPTAGTHIVEARLVGSGQDSLRDDDARFLSVEARRSIGALLVDGRPGRTPFEGQAGYLAVALAPRISAAERTLIAPKIISELELSTEVVHDYDAIVLCNVPRLSAEQWRILEGFVEAGGGLVVFAGDQLGAENYNRLGHAAGAGVLPGEFATGGSVRPNPGVLYKSDGLTHPVVADFADQPASGLFSTRTTEYLPFRGAGDGTETILRYSDGEAALLAGRKGAGRVVVFTTTANMDWTNLPAKGDYVSLMGNIVSFITPRRGDRRNLLVGSAIAEPLPAEASSSPVTAAGPTGAAVPGRVVQDGDGFTWQSPPVEQAGVVRLQSGSDTISYAINVAGGDSDLRSATREDVERSVGRRVRWMGETGTAPPATSGRSSELASLALYAVLVLLVGESLAAMTFSTHQQGG
jgi:hypothetical protein